MEDRAWEYGKDLFWRRHETDIFIDHSLGFGKWFFGVPICVPRTTNKGLGEGGRVRSR